MREVMDEDPAAAAFFKGRERDLARPEEAEWPPWSVHLQRAWRDLRDDRYYGSMGGLGRIYYASISRYAQDHGIIDAAFHEFLIYLRALDDEYVAFENARQKEEADKRKASS